MDKAVAGRTEAVLLILLTLGAFGIRAWDAGASSLAEDEAAKWQAIQEYRQGRFVGVNSEHPMLLKVLAWGSLSLGQRWNRWAAAHRLPEISEEAWLRLPNLILGALTTLLLYLFAKEVLGAAGAAAAAFLWAFSPLVIALNRVEKEDTPLTFFTLLAIYSYLRAKRAPTEASIRRWVDLSGVGYGLALASKYVIHFFGLNALAWYLAGRAGLDPQPLGRRLYRLLGVMALTFVLANPVILSPANTRSILHYVGGGEIQHNGYNLNGQLYLNTARTTPYGLPAYFYLLVIALKSPLLVLAAFLAGAIGLAIERNTLASIYFRTMFLIQLLGISMAGSRWVRYALPLLPFVFLAAGYAVQQVYNWLARFGLARRGLPPPKRRAVISQERPGSAQAGELARLGGRAQARRFWRPALATATALLCAVMVADVAAWSPYYSLYLNSLGGGRANAGRYFPHDEIYDLDARQAIQTVAELAPPGATLATSSPKSAAYCLERFRRSDLRVVPVYDVNYVPRQGDFVVVQDSRRYFETQDLFYFLQHSGAPEYPIYVGGLLTSQIYRFEAPRAGAGN